MTGRFAQLEHLLAEACLGSENALARLMTLAENDEEQAILIKERLGAQVGRAYRVGVTGPPGSGKSTLIDKLIGMLRRQGLTVGVVCVDPSSPLTGGAILGDRIRMEQHYADPGVFIRSMASRGQPGGVAKAAAAAIDLLDASGKDVVIVETVGVGQEGVEVTRLVDTTVLVLAPGWGDDLQLMKAGVLEVADVIVVNKVESGGDSLVGSLREVLGLQGAVGGLAVVAAEALKDRGIDELYEELRLHRDGKDPARPRGREKGGTPGERGAR